MRTITAAATPIRDLDVDVLAVGAFKGGIEGPGTAEALALLGLDDLPVTPAFRGDVGQVLRLAAPGQPFRSLVLVGLGRMDGISPAVLRRAAGDVARAAPAAGTIATTLAEVHPTRAAIEAVADGLALGSHVDRRFKGAGSPDAAGDEAGEGVLLLPSSLLREAEAAIERSAVTSAAVAFARELVNTPPGLKTPVDLAAAVADRAPAGVAVVSHDEGWLAERGCGGILGVARGAATPPRLVEMTYEPPNPLAHVVLAGKGITFDTGGLNLKPGAGMMTMKSDMGGAAAVAGAVIAAAQLGARVKVTGLLALAENAIGGDAQRPSDVITTFDGTTVEIINTDAEGRLALADAIGYGVSLEPDAIVDLATLTGAAVVALGPSIAGLMGDDDDLLDALALAAEDAGEPVWHLPLPEEYDRWLESPIADVDNLGRASGAGALVAGLFLRRFAGDVPWAHLDIAGPAFRSPEDAGGHQPEGGTGFGVTTLVHFLQAQGG